MEYNKETAKEEAKPEEPETRKTGIEDKPEPDEAEDFEVSDGDMDTDDTKNYTPGQVYKIQRPSLLSVLCVLTFIGSGLSAFSNAVMWISLPALKDAVLATDLYESYFALFPEIEPQFMAMLEVPSYFYLLSALAYIGSVTGAVWMWRLQRKGFHLYTISQCILILISMLMMPNAGVPWASVLWTGVFVTLYATHLKYMYPQKK